MNPRCFRPERPKDNSPGQSAATPWVIHPPSSPSPVGAKQNRAGRGSAPPWCRPFRACRLSNRLPRALPWAIFFRSVGAESGDCVLARHYGFTDEELGFILNYDIKYRMGRDTENEED